MRITKLLVALLLAFTAIGGSFANLYGFPEEYMPQTALAYDEGQEMTAPGINFSIISQPSRMNIGETAEVSFTYDCAVDCSVSAYCFEIMSEELHNGSGESYVTVKAVKAGNGYIELSNGFGYDSARIYITVVDPSTTTTAVTSTTTKRTPTTTTTIPAEECRAEIELISVPDTLYGDSYSSGRSGTLEWKWIENNCGAQVRVGSDGGMSLYSFYDNGEYGSCGLEFEGSYSYSGDSANVYVEVVSPYGDILQREQFTVYITPIQTTMMPTTTSTTTTIDIVFAVSPTSTTIAADDPEPKCISVTRRTPSERFPISVSVEDSSIVDAYIKNDQVYLTAIAPGETVIHIYSLNEARFEIYERIVNVTVVATSDELTPTTTSSTSATTTTTVTTTVPKSVVTVRDGETGAVEPRIKTIAYPTKTTYAVGEDFARDGYVSYQFGSFFVEYYVYDDGTEERVRTESLYDGTDYMYIEGIRRVSDGKSAGTELGVLAPGVYDVYLRSDILRNYSDEAIPTLRVTILPAGDLPGDANCDGYVNMSDAVFIMRAQADPDKYTLSETGRINADVYGNGDGVTNNDALAIQKYEAGIYSALPVS